MRTSVAAVAGLFLLSVACASVGDPEAERLRAENARLQAELREAEAHIVQLENAVLSSAERGRGPRVAESFVDPDAVLAAFLREQGADTPEEIRAIVVSVDEGDGTVRLLGGRKRGLRPGLTLVIARNDELFAALEVTRVEEEFSEARRKGPASGGRIHNGDVALCRP